MPDVIKLIPDLPAGLREAAQRAKLIPFVGAGASKIAGCPNWNEFADRALQFFVEKGKFSHAQLSQISHLHPRVKLSIARSLQQKHGIEIEYSTFMYPQSRLDDQKGRQLYENLSKLGKTFVTTNYDEWLDTTLGAPVITGTQASPSAGNTVSRADRNVVYKVSELTAFNLGKPDTVIHLHGSLRDPKSMILTTNDYVRHYRNDRRVTGDEENYVLTFLDYLFANRTVLFVGYGLEELEILEYVIGKARREGDGARGEIRHYILQGFFSHELEVMTNLETYYLGSGIQLIPFLRDQKNWDQLIDVLAEFGRHAPASEPMKIEEFREMGALLE